MQCGKCLDTIETLLKDDVDIDKLNAKKTESINSLSVPYKKTNFLLILIINSIFILVVFVFF